MTLDFIPEVAKYAKSNFGSVRAYCFAPLAMHLVLLKAARNQETVRLDCENSNTSVIIIKGRSCYATV